MIQGDSIEYDMLKLACDSLTGDDFFTCEIGVRQGEGSKIILDAFKNKNLHKFILEYICTFAGEQ